MFWISSWRVTVAGNTFGQAFTVTTFGESHGVALGAVVDGCPPGLPLTEADLQGDLDRRRPGQSKYTTQRKEPDQVRILSGVFEGLTTGTPIGLVIENVDQKSKDYSDIRDLYRPAHADFTYEAKYGIRDYRGGGRSSARETAMRVAAGAIARKYLGSRGITIRGVSVRYRFDPHRAEGAGRRRGQRLLLPGSGAGAGDRRADRSAAPGRATPSAPRSP